MPQLPLKHLRAAGSSRKRNQARAPSRRAQQTTKNGDPIANNTDDPCPGGNNVIR